LISYVVYLGQFFWPNDLALLYPRRGPDLPLWQVVGAGLVVLGITAAVFLWRREYPYLIVGWLWYLAMMSPMVGLVAFGNEAPADRFTYLPQIGIVIGLAWWGADWCWRKPHRGWIYGVASVSAILVFMACGTEQASYWRNSETLWRHTLACTTDNYWVCNQLGDALGTAGRYDDAQRTFLDAARIIEKRLNVCKARPAGKLKTLEEKGLQQDYSTVYYRLGVTAASRDWMDRAVVYYQKALDIDNNNSLAHNNLGYALLVSGEYYEAIRHFEEAARISPEFAAAHFNQGQALYGLGHYRAAIAEYRKAIKLKADYAEAYCCLGLTLAANGQRDEAIAQFRKALAIKPDFKEARNYLEFLLKQPPAKSAGHAAGHRP
jgi:protein O-mannosyl-transferase